MPYKRGAPEGNQNRLIHGRFGKAIMARKAIIHRHRQTVRAVIVRVNVIARVREALRRKKTRLLEARPLRYTRALCTVFRKRGQMPRFRELEQCVGSKWRQYFGRNREPADPVFKLLMYWATHCEKEDWKAAKVMQLIWACGIDPASLLAK
jgi:hypothetical protein